MPHDLNSPQEVYFFTKQPDQYAPPHSYYPHEIRKAQENDLEQAKSKIRSSGRLEIVRFDNPTVDVEGNEYAYIARSFATRDQFKAVMSPEYVSIAEATGHRQGLRGLHYSAHGTYGDAIGITVKAETPEEAKEQFLAWYSKVNDALKVLSERFAIVNKEFDQKIAEWAAQRLDELNRAKKAL